MALQEKLISSTAREDVEAAHVSPKAKSMKMLRQELINSPCKRTQPKQREDWNSSNANYSRKILRSVIISATKQPCRMNPDRYEKVNFLFLSAFFFQIFMQCRSVA